VAQASTTEGAAVDDTAASTRVITEGPSTTKKVVAEDPAASTSADRVGILGGDSSPSPRKYSGSGQGNSSCDNAYTH
jgi:hypothetical protein